MQVCRVVGRLPVSVPSTTLFTSRLDPADVTEQLNSAIIVCCMSVSCLMSHVSTYDFYKRALSDVSETWDVY